MSPLTSILLRAFCLVLLTLALLYPLFHLFLLGQHSHPDYHARITAAALERQGWRHGDPEAYIFACLVCGRTVGIDHNDAYSCLSCNQTSFASECGMDVSDRFKASTRYAMTKEYITNSTALTALQCDSPHSWWCPFTFVFESILLLPCFHLHPVSLIALVFIFLLLRYGRLYAQYLLYLYRLIPTPSQVVHRELQKTLAAIPIEVSDSSSSSSSSQTAIVPQYDLFASLASVDSELRQRNSTVN